MSRSQKPICKLINSLILSLALIPTLTYAQAQDEEASAASLEEVIVTAMKREQSANDIGVSLVTLSGEQLAALGVESVADVMQYVPGATITYSGQGVPVYTIRGIGFDDYNSNSSSTVGVNVDEVALPYPIMTRVPQYDIERLEVLKGPQGTLYGQNTTGGSINFIRNRPEAESSASVRAEFDTNQKLTAQGYVNGSITESLAARASFFFENGGAWQKNAAVGGEGQEHGDMDRQAMRLQLGWMPTENLDIRFAADYHKDQSDNIVPKFHEIFFINPDANLGGSDITGFVEDEITAAGLPDPSDVNSASWNPEGNQFGGDHPRGTFDRDNKGLLLTLRLDWNLENMTFTSLTSMNDYQRDEATGWDGVATRNWDSYNNSDIQTWSQELRLTSNTDSAFSWIVGFYAAGDELKEISTGSGVETTANVYITPEDLGIDINGDGVIDIKDVQAAGLNFDTFSTRYTQETDSWALFAHTDYEFSDAVSMNFGVRYTDDKRKIIDSCTYDVDGLLANFFNIAVFGGYGDYVQGDCVTLNPETFESLPYNETISSDSFTGKVGLDWHVTDNSLLYGNVATGYKSGGFGAPAAASWDSLASYGEEEVTSYEIGLKSTLADGRVQLNAAVYRYDYKDKQVSSFIIDPVFGSLTKIVNAPKAEISGAELELLWSATPSTLVGLRSAYMDSEYKEFSSYLFGQSLADHPEKFDLAGTRMQNTPKWQHTLSVQHEKDLGSNKYLFLGGVWSYSDEFISLVGNNPAFKVDSYDVLDLRAGVAASDNRWLLALWAKNALDNDYYTAISPSNDANIKIVGLERRFGVTFQYNWQ